MKPNKPNAQEKRSALETLHTLWVPMAVGAVLLVMLAIVANLVWKDYSTALMDSQTRQMELVVQSLADSIEFSLDEYTDRLDSAARKVSEEHNLRPGLARSDTLRDIWIEDSEGNIAYSCYGVTASCDVLLTRTDTVSYWHPDGAQQPGQRSCVGCGNGHGGFSFQRAECLLFAANHVILLIVYQSTFCGKGVR